MIALENDTPKTHTHTNRKTKNKLRLKGKVNWKCENVLLFHVELDIMILVCDIIWESEFNDGVRTFYYDERLKLLTARVFSFNFSFYPKCSLLKPF